MKNEATKDSFKGLIKAILLLLLESYVILVLWNHLGFVPVITYFKAVSIKIICNTIMMRYTSNQTT